jgi:hypothetical protein
MTGFPVNRRRRSSMNSGLSRKKPPVKEAQTLSTSLTSDPVKNRRPTKTKSRKPQTDVGTPTTFPTNATADKSHTTPTMCAQSGNADEHMVANVARTQKRRTLVIVSSRVGLGWRR